MLIRSDFIGGLRYQIENAAGDTLTQEELREVVAMADQIEALCHLVADLAKEVDIVGGSGWRDETDKVLERALRHAKQG